MKRTTLLILLVLLFGISSFAQKAAGFGLELSVLSIKPNYRMWISRTTGFEVFVGQAARLNEINPDDLEAGFKFLKSFQYSRFDRTYFGLVGKWKWNNVYDSDRDSNLPVAGVLIGKEWFIKKRHLRGLAIELGYQYGRKIYEVQNFKLVTQETFEEFPYIMNLRYTFYKRR